MQSFRKCYRRKKSIKERMIKYFQSQNVQQLMTVFYKFIGDLINIITSNLCLLFVPQKEYTLSTLPIIVLSINTTTLITFLYLCLYEIKREVWLIKHFDYSKRYDSLHLNKYSVMYPELFDVLISLNYRYYKVYYITRIISMTNFCISFGYIIYFNYLDYKTITTLFINLWFCWSKLSTGLCISKQSIENNVGYSYYNTQNMSFNRIDPQFKLHESNSNTNAQGSLNEETYM